MGGRRKKEEREERIRRREGRREGGGGRKERSVRGTIPECIYSKCKLTGIWNGMYCVELIPA